MYGRHNDPPASVYLLADHLDAILAAGEDILAARAWIAPTLAGLERTELDERARILSGFAQALQSRELSIAAHLRQARLRAGDVGGADQRFASLIKLFLGGTAALAEALDELGAPAGGTFASGNDLITYFRSRAVIGAEAPGLDKASELAPSEGFAIAGRIELGPLMDLASAFLNSLDTAYDLYGDDSGDLSEIVPDSLHATGPCRRPGAAGSE